jgi:hypothetical protein
MATKGHPDEEDCGSPVADPTSSYQQNSLDHSKTNDYQCIHLELCSINNWQDCITNINGIKRKLIFNVKRKNT